MFEIGDKVTLIKEVEGYSGDNTRWSDIIIYGKVYEVLEIIALNSSDPCIKVEKTYAWAMSRFKKVENAKPQTAIMAPELPARGVGQRPPPTAVPQSPGTFGAVAGPAPLNLPLSLPELEELRRAIRGKRAISFKTLAKLHEMAMITYNRVPRAKLVAPTKLTPQGKLLIQGWKSV